MAYMKTHQLSHVVAALVKVWAANKHSNTKTGEALGVHPSEISRVRSGNAFPSKKLVAALGYEAKTVYLWKGTE